MILVEHSFITRLAAEEALLRADDLLGAFEFVREPSSEPNVIEFRRGRRKAAKARKVSELPQRLRLEYDRGRVALAASLEEYRKAGPLHRELLLTLAESLELAIGQERPLEEARARCYEIHEQIDARACRRRWRDHMMIAALLLFIVVVLGIAFATAALD